MDITYLADVSADIIAKCVLLTERVMDHWVAGTSDLELTASGQGMVLDAANIIDRILEMTATFLA